MDGYALPQQIALLKERALKFSPDIVIVTHYRQGRLMTETFLTKVLWAGYPIADERLDALLSEAGLDQLDRGSVPIPSATARRLAKQIGLEPRMPSGEFSARVHRISDDFVDQSFIELAEISSEHGIKAIVLALDDVLDSAAEDVPNRQHDRRGRAAHLQLVRRFPGHGARVPACGAVGQSPEQEGS